MPEVSVIIPTHDRLDVLPEVLQALERQEEPPEFEVLVVDDGSQPATAEFLRAWRPRYPHRVLSQSPSGPAVARNAGVRAAAGRWVAFLGDDTVPRPDWLRAHRRAHRERGEGDLAVIGYTGWHPRMRRTRFLDYINEHGLQFGYALIEDRERVPFNFFYTSNVSLPRELLLEVGLFDTSFPHAAWEDIEVAYRLMQRGMRMLYRASAVARHHHEITFASFRRRQEKAGEAAAIFYRKHPELGDFLAVPLARQPPSRATLSRHLFPLWAALAERSELPGARWALDRVLKEDYLRGLRRGLEAASIPR